ncbi:hypothetical protein NE237_009035 [Protea cynaroides]|uniref:UspA domain-containing protein n=1 Tax=Protea cynaroides TaxID=273540 RepID=A0A9Q0R0C0_9MAGN|nr:hypothetical protein NE237_009035 [Protea cynaroides]
METTCTSERGAADQERMKQQQQAMVEVEKKQLKVMVAIEESEGSFHALKWVLDHFFFLPSSSSAGEAAEAESTQNHEKGMLILFHVQQPLVNYFVPADPGIYVAPLVLESIKKAQEQNSAVLLGRALKLCKERQVKTEAMIANGEPKEMICQAAEQIHPTLLVVGSRGLGMIKRTILGSVSDYCVHHAKCPILIVKPPK